MKFNNFSSQSTERQLMILLNFSSFAASNNETLLSISTKTLLAKWKEYLMSWIKERPKLLCHVAIKSADSKWFQSWSSNTRQTLHFTVHNVRQSGTKLVVVLSQVLAKLKWRQKYSTKWDKSSWLKLNFRTVNLLS